MPDYDRDAHRSIRQFWRSLQGHEFEDHPVLSKHGDNLSKEAYHHTAGRAEEANAQMHDMMRLAYEITQLEQPHRQELEQLAIRITTEVWGIPADMLEAHLINMFQGEKPDLNDTDDLEFDEMEMVDWDKEVIEHPPDPEEIVNRAEVHKRMTLNMYTHGSAVHGMMTAHHLAAEELESIDPDILSKYNQISSGAHHQYWMMDVDAMLAMLVGSAAGSVEVILHPKARDEDEEDEEENEDWEAEAEAELDPDLNTEPDIPSFDDEEEKPKIVAKGFVFPVLVQELFKGVAELLSHHGLADYGETETKAILKKADAIEHEPFLIQVGPEAWRRLLKVMPKGAKLAEVYKFMANLPPQDLHQIVDLTINEPEKAAKILSSHMDLDDDEEYVESFVKLLD